MGKKLRQTEDGQEYTLLVQVDANDLTQHDQDDVKMMDAKVTRMNSSRICTAGALIADPHPQKADPPPPVNTQMPVKT